jgi:hypothetical protein
MGHMSASSSHSPKLIVPGQVTPASAQQLYVTNASGAVQRTIAVTPRVDPGFFRKLLTDLNPLRSELRTAVRAHPWIGVTVLALDALATANVGNPFLLYDRRERWKEVSGLLEGSSSDLWRSYFDDVSPNWQGSASQMLQQHIRFNVHPLYSRLDKISRAMSDVMHSLYKEVVEYDLSLLGLYAGNAPIIKLLSKLSANPTSSVAMYTQMGIFAAALGNLTKQFADIFVTYESQLQKLELALNDIKGAFYIGGDPTQGPRDLKLSSSVTSPTSVADVWQPFPDTAGGTTGGSGFQTATDYLKRFAHTMNDCGNGVEQLKEVPPRFEGWGLAPLSGIPLVGLWFVRRLDVIVDTWADSVHILGAVLKADSKKLIATADKYIEVTTPGVK